MAAVKIVFLGTAEFAVPMLQALVRSDWPPVLVITQPDQPAGRRQALLPPPIKLAAQQAGIPISQPSDHDALAAVLRKTKPDLCVLVAYGTLIKKETLLIPRLGFINIHPSLLPQYRGPSPIQTAILNGDGKTGVTIMLLDNQVDHGPILATKTYYLKPITYHLVRDELAKLGAELLIKILPDYLAGKIKPVAQDHTQATFTKKIEKSDGEVMLDEKNNELNYRKFLAYTPWPGIYFFDKKNKRIKITDAILENEKFIIKKVVPEGRPEMLWEDYQRGL